MKRIFRMVCVALLGLILVGCRPISPEITLAPTEAGTNTLIHPSAMPTVEGRVLQTSTQEPTLSSEEAASIIGTLMTNALSCSNPCFWGIFPEKTSLGEASRLFNRLGFTSQMNVEAGKRIYAFDLINGTLPGISVSVSSNGSDVTGINAILTSIGNYEGTPSKVPDFMPGKLINIYGEPSEVLIGVGLGPGPDKLFMQMYFGDKDLAVAYTSGLDITLEGESTLCPGNIEFNSVRIWSVKTRRIPLRRQACR